VDRPRLLHDVDAICSCPLTLVSASAGSGKTTLLSTWITETVQRLARLSQTGRSERDENDLAVAWLSLDVMDNDPLRFWASCIAALQTCLPEIGQAAFTLLLAQEAPPLSSILTMLLNELREVRQEVILILDDYHVIEHLAISESMLFFLDHLPGNLHLVFATRADPELPLARWRVRGQLNEIRDRDLRFSQEEADSFLRQATGQPLSEEEIAILQRHTEGWIAGLQLVALSISRRENVSAFVKDFGGSHRFVLDYVQDDLLPRPEPRGGWSTFLHIRRLSWSERVFSTDHHTSLEMTHPAACPNVIARRSLPHPGHHRCRASRGRSGIGGAASRRAASPGCACRWPQWDDPARWLRH
jgi:LuxR family maltose regulon positive regulatory protein